MLMGSKRNRHLYKYLIERAIPEKIKIYVEPFGGEFGLWRILKNKPDFAVYNDIDKKLYEKVSKELEGSGVKCFNNNYKDIINLFDTKETLFYVDPPYYQKYYYNYNFETDKEHIELANILKNIKGKFLLSYQDKPFILDLYKDFIIDKYSGVNKMYKPEITIRNYV